MPVDMTLKELQEKLKLAEKNVTDCKLVYAQRRREFVEVETNLISAREVVIKLNAQIQAYKNERDIGSTLDDVRDREIERFSKILPDMMKRIKDEPKIPPVDILDDR